MQNLHEKIADHFSRYKESDVVFVSDGRLFLSESAAESYGTGPVEKFKREDIQDYKLNLLTIEVVEQMTYNQLKDKVAELELEVVDKKKNNLKDALLAFINQK